jgi:uncharacterized membrane protein
MRQDADVDDGSWVSLERTVLFSDAIFAIVITILVLPLTADVSLDPSRGFTTELWDMRYQVLAFVLGFFVVGQFWVAHHRLWGQLAGVDFGLLWINLLALLTVTFMPFPTAVLGGSDTSNDQGPVVFFAASMAMAGIALAVLWFYASRRRLVDPAITPQERRLINARSVITVVGFCLAVGVAFWGLVPAVLMWMVAVPAARRFVGHRFAAG